jgi:hypothetical protein
VAEAMVEQHTFFVSHGLKKGKTPHEYSRPSGNAFWAYVEGDRLSTLRRNYNNGGHGVRFYDHDVPERDDD